MPTRHIRRVPACRGWAVLRIRSPAVQQSTAELYLLEISQHVGADKYERVAGRSGERNGYRDRNWDTRVGSIELRVPRRRGERALVAVVQEACVKGESTRRV